MHFKKFFLLFPALFAVLLLSGCAGQVPPGGGPVDYIPPSIVSTVPDSNSIHVKNNSIELEFSEYVDRRSVEESIFISPYVGDLEFDWGTTTLRVKFSQELRKNTTYVVNVGTDVVDLRAHNRMAAGYTLAFSSGDSIDQGAISGRVFDEKPEGIMIFAYGLANYNPDTLDPARVKPDYIMQTGKNGLFSLSHIAMGSYRLIAVRDEYRNLLYDKQVDQFGLTVGDTTLTPEHPRVSDLWFRLSVEDTSKPFLTNVQVLSDQHVQVRFSEPVDSLSFRKASFTIVDTLKNASLPIILSSLSISTPTLVDLLTETRLDSGLGYRVVARQIVDRSGNPIDSSNSSLAFVGTATPDTVRPAAAVRGVADSAKGIPLEQRFELSFSEPVLHAPIINSVVLMDSSRAHVGSRMRWLNATDLEIIPNSPLKSKVWYQFRITMDSVRDYAGNTWKDSTRTVHFESLDLRTTGAIDGVVVDDARKGRPAPVFVTAVRIDATPQQEKTLRLAKAGSFTFQQLPEGKYSFRAFSDDDSSGSYSFGKPFPFIPAERFAVSPDTVKVRARWGVEGVVLKFK